MRLTPAIKTALITLLLFIILSFTLLGWCVFTTRGSNISLSALQHHLSGLSYTYKSGNLARGIMLDDLKWNLKNKTQIRATNIELKWNPACWRGREFCLKSASADEVTIVPVSSTAENNPVVLPLVDLPFSLQTDALSIGKLIIENGGRYPIELDNIEFNGSLGGSNLMVNSLQLDWQWIRAHTSGTMRLIDNYPLTMQGKVSTVDRSRNLPIEGGFILEGDLLDLMVDSEISVPYPADINGSMSLLARSLPVDLDINWKKISWPRDNPDATAFVNDGKFKLSGNWPDYDVEGRAEISGSAIPAATAILKGTVNTKRATYNTLRLNTLDGFIDATGTVKWRNGISWQTALQTDNLNPGVYWENFNGNISGSAMFNGRNNNGLTRLNFTDIKTRGHLHGHPFSVTGSVSKSAEGSYHFAALEARSINNTLSANGNLDSDSDMSLLFSMKSPQDFIPDLYGDLYGNLVITGDMYGPDISGTASSASLSYGNTTIINTKLAGELLALGQNKSQLKSVSEKIYINNTEFNDVQTTLNGSLDNHIVKAKMTSQHMSLDALEVRGSVDQYRNWTGLIKRVRGNLGSHPVWLDKPFTATWITDDKTMALQAHCWTINLASACMPTDALVGRTGTINFVVDGLNLQTLDSLYAPNVTAKGYLRSTGALQWSPGQRPKIHVDTEITDASVRIKDAKTQKEIPIDITNARFSTTTKNNLIKTHLKVISTEQGELTADITIDASKDSYPLNGTVRLSDSHLEWLAPYTPQLTRLEGIFAAQAQLGGYLSSPVFNARVNIDKAAVASPQLPVDLDDISLTLNLTRDTAELSGQATTDGKPIKITGSGKLFDQQWESDLNIKADRIQINHEFLENAIASPDLTIRMNPSGITIRGSVYVPRAEIKIDQIPNTGIALSNDVIVVDSNSEKIVKKNKLQNISTKVRVTLGRDVNFKGFGLNADLRGNMVVKLAPQSPPDLLGEIIVDSGTYRSYGQNLVIRDGRINFVGPLNQAALSVEAFRKVGDVIAGLRVDGSLQNPTTTLFSEPQLPQDEILSYVVLGRQIQFDGDDTDDSQILANAALFMGISNGRNLSQNFARNLGIKDFSLTSSGTGDDTKVMLSGRINSRLLVRYGVGIFNSVNTLFMRYDLADSLYLETTQGLERAVDLFYSFEFD